MRFLVDENLSPRICTLLTSAGHDATHVRDHGMAGANDHQGWPPQHTDIVIAALGTGAFIVLTPTSVRVRHLPIR